MSTITLPKKVDASKITFSDIKKNNYNGKNVYLSLKNRPITVQTPYMPLPFSISEYELPSGDIKYSLDFSFKNLDNSRSTEYFWEMLENMDNLMIEKAVENSKEWFGKTYEEDIVRAFYTPMIRHSIDKSTGEINHKYAPTFRVKIPKYNNEFNVEVFDEKNNELSKDLHMYIQKHTNARVIMKCSGVWFAGGKFGVSWRLLHVQVKTDESNGEYNFIQDSDGDENETTEENNDASSFYHQY